jgi:hypothetical protein
MGEQSVRDTSSLSLMADVSGNPLLNARETDPQPVTADGAIHHCAAFSL